MGHNRVSYVEAIVRADILNELAAFDPHVAGTLPLGIALPTSDIDVLCYAPDHGIFTAVLWTAFRYFENFSLRQRIDLGRPVICSFLAHGWVIEVYGGAEPIARQSGWRHLLVQRRLLALGGDAFRQSLIAKRREGAKTEPAFAAVLGLSGDPYEALLALEPMPESKLRAMLRAAGFSAPATA